MYNTIKLEKGMYNLSGKTFSQALEERDPSENYRETALENLDAFERQLKRFDIKVAGENCDRVEKFFETTESAVLFPEFIRRSIRAGFDGTAMEKITAARTSSESSNYTALAIDDSTAYATVSQAGQIAETVIREESSALALKKYARILNSSYESLRKQRLDLFAIALRNIGLKLSGLILANAVTTIKAGCSTVEMSGSDLSYSDLCALYGSFETYKMDKVIVSPANAAKILAMPQLMETRAAENGRVYLPFGAEMIVTSQVDDLSIIGLDSSFALELITGTDIVLDTDKIIERQLDKVGVSVIAGFNLIFPAAAAVLDMDV